MIETSANNSQPFLVNARFRRQAMTGVQRYADEICRRLRGELREIVPPGYCRSGIRGHFWEQTILPSRAKGKVLWSPCNGGPLSAKKHVVTIHDMAVFDRPQDFSRLYAAGHHVLTPRLIRNAARVLTVSEFSKTRIVELTGVHADKVFVIPNGVDLKRFGTFQPLDARHSDRLPEKNGLPFVLTVGSLNARKNLNRLLSAWNLACREQGMKDVELYVVGDVSARVFSRLEMPSIPKNVKILGRVSDAELAGLYRDALVCVNPSLYEGFGLPLVEAFAAGCPVICSNRTSYPEVGGEVVEYFDPENPENIAELLVRAVANFRQPEQRRRQAELVRQRARRFDWNQSAEMLFRILQEVADEE